MEVAAPSTLALDSGKFGSVVLRLGMWDGSLALAHLPFSCLWACLDQTYSRFDVGRLIRDPFILDPYASLIRYHIYIDGKIHHWVLGLMFMYLALS